MSIRHSSPPRVLHLVPAPFDAADGTLGGAERYVDQLARHMAVGGTPTTLLSFGERAREETTAEGLRVRVLPRPWRVRGQRHNPLAWGLVPEVGRHDVIHCHQTHVLASSLAAALGRLTGKRVFTTDLGGGGWDVSAYVNTDRWYHGHLHISEYSRRVAGHEHFARAHVILGGVDGQKFAPADPLQRPMSPDAPVLYVGRLFPHKGVDDLIRAIPPTAERAPRLRLDVIGRPGDEECFGYLRALAAGRPVRFRPDCSDAELAAALRTCLCLVLPSVYRTSRDGAESRVPELLGQTLLEAMAGARPTVCTDVASLPEIVVDGQTGFIVPPNDPAALGEKLAWLRDHPAEADAMGTAGRRRALAHFSWPAVVTRCLELYAAAAA